MLGTVQADGGHRPCLWDPQTAPEGCELESKSRGRRPVRAGGPEADTSKASEEAIAAADG